MKPESFPAPACFTSKAHPKALTNTLQTRLCTILIAATLTLGSTTCAADARPNYAHHKQAEAFIADMVNKHGFKRERLEQLFAKTEYRDDIIRLMKRPAEGKDWKDYRPIFITEKRIQGGVAFWNKHAALFDAMHKRFGVPAQIVTAIIGVETFYGGNIGRHRVIDAISTLAFDYPPRAKFFRNELQNYLQLCREEGFDPLSHKGSYAGAMGLGQFIPSSYRHYAVDGDNDGQRDLWDSPADIIFSVANYFAEHGWHPDEAIAAPLKLRNNSQTTAIDKLANQGLKPATSWSRLQGLGATTDLDPGSDLKADTDVTVMKLNSKTGAERWIGLHNFYVITRYNHSHKYAMAVFQLSEAILKRHNVEKQVH